MTGEFLIFFFFLTRRLHSERRLYSNENGLLNDSTCPTAAGFFPPPHVWYKKLETVCNKTPATEAGGEKIKQSF